MQYINRGCSGNMQQWMPISCCAGSVPHSSNISKDALIATAFSVHASAAQTAAADGSTGM
jgi:hypothetical protein